MVLRKLFLRVLRLMPSMRAICVWLPLENWLSVLSSAISTSSITNAWRLTGRAHLAVVSKR